MRLNMKKIMKNIVTVAYKLARGVDYRTLSRYILKINQCKDIDSILAAVSQCLDEILSCELCGFVLKKGEALDIWVAPCACSSPFIEVIIKAFPGQKIDATVHYFNDKTAGKSHYIDVFPVAGLVSYNVMEGNYLSRLYILPKRKKPSYHDNIIHTVVSSIRIALDNSLCISRLEDAAAVDPLTNCYNRRALKNFIESDIAYAQRNGIDLSVVMLDLDNFKEINDRYGHHAGDSVLKAICPLILGLVRKSDYLARYGGEEFVLVLPDTFLWSAVQLAEKLRENIGRHAIDIGEKEIAVTASFGVASLRHDSTSSSLLREADERLYRAKAAGKNIVVPALPKRFTESDEAQENVTRQTAFRRREEFSPRSSFFPLGSSTNPSG